MKNRIKNIEGRSTSNEETPEYFGAKGALSLKNENIMCVISPVSVTGFKPVILGLGVSFSAPVPLPLANKWYNLVS